MANVLVLSSTENTQATCDFIVIGIYVDKYFSLNDTEKFHTYIKDTLRRDYDRDYDNFGIIYHGNLTKFSQYNTILAKLPKKGVNSTVQYRDYTRTLEAQLASKSSVIVAEDSATSWNTVRSALGARNIKVECYGVVLEVIKNK